MGNIKSEEIGQRLIDISWAAGLIDGEGSFGLYNDNPVLAVESTCRTVIEEIHRILGGKCYAVKRRTKRNRPVFKWSIHGRNSIGVCHVIAEHLRDKREQAELLTTIYDYPKHSAMRESISRRMSSLKRVSL